MSDDENNRKGRLCHGSSNLMRLGEDHRMLCFLLKFF